MSTPFLISSTSIIIIRSIIVVSRTNWLFLWAALELNLLRFVPILINSKKNQETEATVKYFLVQALGSSVLLMRRISLWFNINIPNQLMSTLIFIALILKIGIAPCHIWYPSVITSISWIAALILSTWQKLAPLIIISLIFTKSISLIIFVLARLNAIVGGIIGINQSHLRTIIAYSSITHIGWIISLIASNKPILTISYFIFYSLIICPIFIIFHIKQTTNTNSTNKLTSYSPRYQIILPILLLSLGGLPPLTGFIPKWITISTLAHISPTTTIILITGAIINTYFYLTIIFNILLRIKPLNLYKVFNSRNNLIFIFLIATTSLVSLPLIFIT